MAVTADKSQFEEFEVKGENLLAKVHEVIHEGNAKRIILKTKTATHSSRCP